MTYRGICKNGLKNRSSLLEVCCTREGFAMISLGCCASLLFLQTDDLFALPVGNPAFPQLLQDGFFIPCNSWVNFRLGYEGDFVSDEQMNQCVEGSGRVDTYQQNTNSGTTTLNFLDRLDVYGVFGSSRMQADWRFSAEDEVWRAQVQSKYRFLWAVGARGLLYDWGCAFLGAGGRYSKSSPEPSWLTINGVPASVSGASIEWHEWQVDLDFALKIDIFSPYVGVKYAKASSHLKNFSVPISSNGSGSLHMQSRTPVGVVIGCTLTTGKYFMLNIEGRLIDEEALTVSGDLRF